VRRANREVEDRSPMTRQPEPNPNLDPAPIAMEGAYRRALETARVRLIIVGLLFALACVGVCARLAEIATFRDAEIRQARLAGFAVPKAARADIVDRNGELLTTSLTGYTLEANVPEIEKRDPAAIARRLAPLLPKLDEAEVLRRLTRPVKFAPIERQLTPRQMAAIRELGIPGLDFKAEEQRVHLHGKLLAHIAGYTDIDGNGIAGVEKTLDSMLRQADAPVALSIDLRLQHILHRELAASIDTFKAIGGAGIIMDAQSGEVLASVSLPDYDPNSPAVATDVEKFNRVTLGVYELGSTFKIFNTAMALESGRVELFERFDATHKLRVGNHVIDDYRGEYKWMNVAEIFEHSSNIGSALIAMQAGRDTQRAFFERIGFTKPLAFELPERGWPLVPHPWRDINAMTISYGHGISVTPLHLVRAVAAMVNGGTLPETTLLKQTSENHPHPRIISPQTSDTIRKLMRLVVESGTGTKAAVPGYLVGGKTGTAEKIVARGYSRNARISSFVAAFPMNAPRYVVFAMLDEPKGTRETAGFATGGWTAAPLVRRVIAAMGPALGIEPVDEQADEIRNALKIAPPSLAEARGQLAAY
jgi:cell division protein FtsI (penicillin-binding protein 3)